MKNYRLKFIVLALAALVLAGCGTKKGLTHQQEPVWHTCLVQGAHATVTRGQDRVSATVTMQTVRDSMIVISVMPMLGIEMLRLEATPEELTAIDKIHGQYATTDFKQLNRQLTPRISWSILQQISSAELPTGAETAHLQYTLGNETIDIVMDYTERKLDVPVRMTKQRTDRYTKIDISKWL